MSATTNRVARVLVHVPGAGWLAVQVTKRNPEMRRQVRANLLASWPREELRTELERREGESGVAG